MKRYEDYKDFKCPKCSKDFVNVSDDAVDATPTWECGACGHLLINEEEAELGI